MIQKYCYAYEQNTTYSFTQYYLLKLPLCMCTCVCRCLCAFIVEARIWQLLASLFCEIESLHESGAHHVLFLCLTPYPLCLAFLPWCRDQPQILMLATTINLQPELSLQLLFVRTLKSTDVKILCISLFNQSVTNHCSWEMHMPAGNNT